ncbi:sensor histidine kinase [Chloroflexota bacterium]
MAESRQPGRFLAIISSPHFWMILLLFAGIGSLYYYRINALATLDGNWTWLWRWAVVEYSYGIHGIILSLPVIYGAIVFKWRGALITCLAAVLILMPRMLFLSPYMEDWASSLIYLILPVAITGIISMELFWREENRRIFKIREAERSVVTAQVFKAQEEERQHIARELHDEALQSLLVIATHSQQLSKEKEAGDNLDLKKELEWITKATIDVSDGLRRLSLALRPSVLDNVGLIPAIRSLTNELNGKGIEIIIKLTGTPGELDSDTSLHIYRIAQEALSNIGHHSKATRAQVAFRSNAGSIRLSIWDNGCGFNVPEESKLAAQRKLGILGMKQRAQICGGRFFINSSADKGTEIVVEIEKPTSDKN